MNQHRIDQSHRQTRKAMPWKALALVVMPAMLMLTAATDDKADKKGGSAVWIALAAVFISLGAVFASRNGAAKKRGENGNSGDSTIISSGSDTGHHKDSHAHDHSSSGSSGEWGSDGGGGDGGGGGD